MTGAITDIGSLQRWFMTNGRPFWTVKYAGPQERIIARNDNVTDMAQAWDNLEAVVRMQTEAGRAVLEVLQYNSEKGAQGHALRTNVDIRDHAPRYAPAQVQPAVAGMPAIGDIQEYIDQKVNLALLEKENEDLRAAINAPSNMLERIVEKVSESPHLSAAVAQLIAGLFNRGAAMPMAVTGIQPDPAAPKPAADGDEHDEERDRIFWENINQAAETLGVDDVTLAVKLNQLVQSNPAMAKGLIA